MKKAENLVELLKLKDEIIWENILDKQNIKKEGDTPTQEKAACSGICK